MADPEDVKIVVESEIDVTMSPGPHIVDHFRLSSLQVDSQD